MPALQKSPIGKLLLASAHVYSHRGTNTNVPRRFSLWIVSIFECFEDGAGVLQMVRGATACRALSRRARPLRTSGAMYLPDPATMPGRCWPALVPTQTRASPKSASLQLARSSSLLANHQSCQLELHFNYRNADCRDAMVLGETRGTKYSML